MQVGEYELTVTDVTVFVIFLVALKKVFFWLRTPKLVEPIKFEVEPLEKQELTLGEVQQLRREKLRCLAVANGKIYDLSSSRVLYENNLDVFEAQEDCGDEWEPIFKRKFPFVGNIVS